MRRRRILPILAAILGLSALVRLAGGVAAPIAAETAADPDPAACAEAPEAMLSAFRARETQLAEAEAALAARQAELARATAELDGRIAALEAMESALSATVATAETAAEDDIARLTAVYENMKPAEAATLFATMDPAFAAGFIGRMRTDAAAAVMSSLEAPAAYAISAVLAGRNANAPTE